MNEQDVEIEPTERQRTIEEQRAEDLSELIQSKWPGYTVAYAWDFEKGWHFTVTNVKDANDKREFVIRREVIQDWPPRQVMVQLEAANWMLFLGASRGKLIPVFTNQGWSE